MDKSLEVLFLIASTLFKASTGLFLLSLFFGVHTSPLLWTAFDPSHNSMIDFFMSMSIE